VRTFASSFFFARSLILLHLSWSFCLHKRSTS
jgi:hypothetical protein